MKTVLTVLAIFLAICQLAQAGAIHLDVAIDIDSEVEDLQRENRYVENDNNLIAQEEPHHNTVDEYDVSLPYEVHRGFLSVSWILKFERSSC